MNIIPYFQPIVDISTAQVVGHEVLARVIDAEGNVLSAGSLFCDESLDEATMLSIDRSVRSSAMARFAAAGQPGFLTINISPRWIELLEDHSVPTIDMLRHYGIRPDKLVVEIVETHSDSDRLSEIVARYKQEGIRVAVDDFGAGFSQFDRVMRLEPDIVKLDMRLFKEAVQGGFPQHVVHSLSFMAERIGSQVLCEGVEDFEELSFALEIGSKLIQGFMFSQAQQDFTDRHAFSRNIASHRHDFLQQRIEKEEQVIHSARNIQAQVEALTQQVRLAEGDFSSQTIDLSPDSGIFRLFICDITGTQISPNYHVADGQWQQSYDGLGTNWCWRPYFYQLLSSAKATQRKSVTSRDYHDVESGMLIKTIACFVDDHRIMMVDIKHQESFSI